MTKIIVTKIVHLNIIYERSFDTKNWFKNFKNKNRPTFIQFDIIDFYPSISKQLLVNRRNFAKNNINISGDKLDIILACRRFILINDNNTWVKSHIDNFDVIIGSFE